MATKPGDAERQAKIAVEQDEAAARLKEEKAALDAEKREITIMRGKLKSEMEAFEVAKGPNFMLSELGEGKSIEMVTDQQYRDKAEAAVFMNEMVKVNVHMDGLPGSLPVVTVNVNGVNQPIIRGRDQWIKRKYVEALARSRITNYTQTEDQLKPENIQMNDITSLTYPFAVREDRNPKGAQWLENILLQP